MYFRKAARLVGMGLAVVGLAAAPAEAQTYAETVWRQLQTAHEAAVAENYQLKNYIIGSLNNGNTDTWSFDLSTGRNYVIIGACDEDCSDLDITVKSATGSVVANDTATDDHPVVNFQPPRNGRYTVEIKMYSCSQNPCYFGFGLFRQ